MADVELSSLGAIIKAAYEAETNTNAFTDAEQTKLSTAMLSDGSVALTGLSKQSVSAGVTADVSSVQGGGAITKNLVQISVCANAGDAVTLPTAVAGYRVTIINNGAQSCDVFPATSDNLGAGANTAAALAAGAKITYVAYDVTNWVGVTGV